jgi:predicted dehydrogenase
MNRDPREMDVRVHKAPTGVDEEVNMLLDFGEVHASLSCSFRVKLPNKAYIFGEKGTLVLPDFWRASECLLYQEDTLIDHYPDGRKGNGFEFEIDAVGRDILEGTSESVVVPHAASLNLARSMDGLIRRF